jgi:hypothetical protein
MSSPPRDLPTKARDCSVSSTVLPPCIEAGQLIHGATLRFASLASLWRPGPPAIRSASRAHDDRVDKLIASM